MRRWRITLLVMASSWMLPSWLIVSREGSSTWSTLSCIHDFFLAIRSRGFGFVTFEDYACVEACLEAQKREPLMMRGKKVRATLMSLVLDYRVLFTHAFFLFL